MQRPEMHLVPQPAGEESPVSKKSRRHVEHAGAKNSSAKSGYYGLRAEAKATSKKSRREQDKKTMEEQR
jgi:hypothetical protein